jgi:hypothetical protein
MYPDDERLLQLDHGERDTDNLSPWPGVAQPGEKMNHDEFMRRTLELAKIPEIGRIVLSDIGNNYLKRFVPSILKSGHWLLRLTKTADWKESSRQS